MMQFDNLLIYRENHMYLADACRKVQQLVDEHIISTGVDTKIPPVDLMAANFRERVMQTRSPEARAAEVESAIEDPVTVNLDEDPEYFKSLSLGLDEIILITADNWEQQLELFLELRESMETDRQQKTDDLGLGETELAFYIILITEVTSANDEAMNTTFQRQSTHGVG